MSKIRLICFDLGGVIVDTARRWEVACQASGVPRRREPAPGADWGRFAEVMHAYETDALSWSEFLERSADALAGMHSLEELARIHEGWLLGEIPGMAEVVVRLNQADGLTTCCLSNTNRRHWEIMTANPDRFATFHALGRRWNSFEIRERKPAPAIFRAAERASGVEGEQILFFDDRQENVEAARICGWIAEPIDRDGDVARQVRSSLSEYRLGGY